jgi:hypothetical protein
MILNLEAMFTPGPIAAGADHPSPLDSVAATKRKQPAVPAGWQGLLSSVFINYQFNEGGRNGF